MPSYVYVDKTLLVLESYHFLNYLQTIPNDNQSLDKEALKIIAIIELFSRFILCEEKTLDLIYPEFNALLESELTSEELKTSINDIKNILNEIKEHIGWAR